MRRCNMPKLICYISIKSQKVFPVNMAARRDRCIEWLLLANRRSCEVLCTLSRECKLDCYSLTKDKGSAHSRNEESFDLPPQPLQSKERPSPPRTAWHLRRICETHQILACMLSRDDG